MEREFTTCPACVVLVLVAPPYLLRKGFKLLAVALVAERIYDAGRGKRLTIGWFWSMHDWIERRSVKRVEAFRASRSSRVHEIGARWSRRAAAQHRCSKCALIVSASRPMRRGMALTELTLAKTDVRCPPLQPVCRQPPSCAVIEARDGWQRPPSPPSDRDPSHAAVGGAVVDYPFSPNRMIP